VRICVRLSFSECVCVYVCLGAMCHCAKRNHVVRSCVSIINVILHLSCLIRSRGVSLSMLLTSLSLSFLSFTLSSALSLSPLPSLPHIKVFFSFLVAFALRAAFLSSVNGNCSEQQGDGGEERR